MRRRPESASKPPKFYFAIPREAENLAVFGLILDDLASQPHMGRVPDDPNLMQMGYRYLVVVNYCEAGEKQLRP